MDKSQRAKQRLWVPMAVDIYLGFVGLTWQVDGVTAATVGSLRARILVVIQIMCPQDSGEERRRDRALE